MSNEQSESSKGRAPGTRAATSSHTPGPWEFRTNPKRIFVVRPHRYIESGEYVCEISMEAYSTDGEAVSARRMNDARLIAAAPELLKLLKDILHYVGPDADYRSECYDSGPAQAAIAKAEGRE